MSEATTSTPERSRRDWIVDWACFAIAIGLGLTAYIDAMPAAPSAGHVTGVVALGLAACLGLWVRRRWPLGVALLTAAAMVVSPVAGGAALIALFSVAVHQPWRKASVAGFALIVSCVASYLIYPNDESIWVNSLLVLIAAAALVGWGMYVKARRELVDSLRERAQAAESDRDARLAQAREQERTRIAREMHDVLAHRISLVAMNSGALEYRPDASPAEVSRAAAVVRENAHLALEELRQVLAVLRGPGEGENAAGEPPQPTLRDMDGLVADSRSSGTVIELVVDADRLRELPDATGRTAYRVIQESLTNVRKHAPGSAAEVAVSGSADDGLTVAVSNQRPVPEVATGAPIPGSGTGLTGLTERVGLAGGSLEYGPGPDGEFRVKVWLPWEGVSPPAGERHAVRGRVDG